MFDFANSPTIGQTTTGPAGGRYQWDGVKWKTIGDSGGNSPPGGLTGNVQYNNAGVLGGLTNTQLTARVAAFSSTLSGAVNASGGGTVNLLRADHAWTQTLTGAGYIIGTADTTGAWNLFGSGTARFGAIGNQNSIIGMAINNTAPATAAFPCGVTAYGKIAAGSNGNAVFGLFGRADAYDYGVVTHEINTFNFKSAPVPTMPPNRGFGLAASQPICWTVAAGGTYQSTIGIEICQEGSQPNSFIHGLYIDPGAATSKGIYIDATSTASATNPLHVRGSASVIVGTFQTRGTPVAGNAALQYIDGNDVVAWGVRQNGDAFGSGISPRIDNNYLCGASGARWSAVWAATGTIQTSDPALKTDIQPLPPMLGLVAKINPISFRWRVGGYDVQVVDEERDVHAIETTDGIERELYDEVPVVDAAGKPVMVPRVIQGGGRNNDPPAVIDGEMPLTRFVPRMVRKPVPTEKAVPHEGKRTHWGFSAPEVKAAFDALGMDFGGYVRADDGTHNLRPDQMIPVLWKAVQELAAQVAALRQP